MRRTPQMVCSRLSVVSVRCDVFRVKCWQTDEKHHQEDDAQMASDPAQTARPWWSCTRAAPTTGACKCLQVPPNACKRTWSTCRGNRLALHGPSTGYFLGNQRSISDYRVATNPPRSNNCALGTLTPPGLSITSLDSL